MMQVNQSHQRKVLKLWRICYTFCYVFAECVDIISLPPGYKKKAAIDIWLLSIPYKRRDLEWHVHLSFFSFLFIIIFFNLVNAFEMKWNVSACQFCLIFITLTPNIFSFFIYFFTNNIEPINKLKLNGKSEK